ncbi:uncharacterized protein LOC131859016 [Cryptomeria japonica]|uniref:uncharacterized protein LOC131859016 n=1 Tax=Cryptomeria japonica TaxID=3369 RepID=UPI0027DA101D|nr:uncharacterized protein LOC131859016 [Cryptomeria japonica]
MELNGSFESTLVWVMLPNLPLEFWVEDVFLGIANSFGELVAIDPMIAARKRLVYARICVNISQNMDLPSSIDISSKLGLWEQTIEFKSLPFVCFSYKKVGHWAKACPSNPKKPLKANNPHKQVWREKTNIKEDSRLEGGSGIPSNLKDVTEDDRKASPLKVTLQKEDKKNENGGFEIKTVNGFEALQTWEEENVNIEEILEEGEIDDMNESQHEGLQVSVMKSNKAVPNGSEGPEVIFERKNKFKSPQVNLNSLFQNVGAEKPTSSQKGGEPWNNKQGRKPMKWHRDQESKQNIADGRQQTI